jgi:hypothetical protein
MSFWSGWRSRTMALYPWHLPVFYALALMAGVTGTLISGLRRRFPLSPLLAILPLMGAIEFAVSSLSDASETDRHLLLFHALTDGALAMTIGAGIEFLHRLSFRMRRPYR